VDVEITQYDMMAYDTIRHIYVRSKVDKMANLVQRTAQTQKIKEKLKTKTD